MSLAPRGSSATRRRAVRAVVVVVAVLAATGCALLGRSDLGGRRRFYLTKDVVPANRALGACGRGFHMASRFEIANVTALDYETRLGLVADDSGSGPPSVAGTYGTPGPVGWVRTGGGAQYSDATREPGAASTNCAVWTTSSHDAFGTVAYLADRFGAGGDPAGVWSGRSEPCDGAFHVWCVEDGDDGEFAFRFRRRRDLEPHGPPGA